MGLFDKIKDVMANVTEQKPDDQVVMIDNDDAIMADAIEKARGTLPDYLAFFQNAPVNTRNHRVKAHFKDGCNNEHIWLIDFTQEGDVICGTVGNNPELVTNVAGGQQVQVPMEDISDWGFEAGGKQYGNYTVYAMFRTMAPGLVQQYVDGYGFTQNPLEQPGITFAQLIADLPAPGEDDAEDMMLPGLDEKLEQELQKRMENLFEGEDPDERERRNAAYQFAKEIMQELEGSRYAEAAKRLHHKYEQDYLQLLGFSDADKAAAAVDDAELIGGMTLADYAAASAKRSAGASLEAVCEALGITEAQFNEGNEGWAQRMAEDTSFQVSTQFAEHFAAAGNHPKLGGL